MSQAILILCAHPYPDRSRAGSALLEAVRDLPGVEIRMLYALYPDFWIDVDAERAAVLRADVIVWQSPLFWYGLPSLMHLWIEKVLAEGWAFGRGGDKVRGKRLFWVTTTGDAESTFRPGAIHGHHFDAFVPPVSQTARFCGMQWEPPLVVHASGRSDPGALRDFGYEYRKRLERLASRPTGDADRHA